MKLHWKPQPHGPFISDFSPSFLTHDPLVTPHIQLYPLCGLRNQVPYYDYALDLILDVDSSHGEKSSLKLMCLKEDEIFSEQQIEQIESAVEMLYGLIHVRCISTTKGLCAMLEKYKNIEFGRCPKVYYCGKPCLPFGQSDISHQSNVTIYCPKCEDIYTPQFRYHIIAGKSWQNTDHVLVANLFDKGESGKMRILNDFLAVQGVYEGR